MSPPVISPDSRAYITMADNIRLNGCISYSDPATRACVAAWGTQPPGYPMFLASIRAVTTDERVAVAAQVFLFALAAAWLMVAAAPGRIGVIAVGTIALCASPLTFAWGRWILTETLASAAAMMVFAFLLTEFRRRQVRVAATGLVLAIALSIRWDLALLVVPVFLLAWSLTSLRRAFPLALGISVLAVTPYAAMAIRAVRIGLPIAPSNVLDEDLPAGLLRFWRTTALDQRAVIQLIWPVWSHRYETVKSVDSAAIVGAARGDDFRQLLAQLSVIPPTADIPASIDTAFGDLARRFTRQHPVRSRFGVPFTRAVRMWTMEDGQYSSGWQSTVLASPTWESGRTAYRITILVLCVVAGALAGGQIRTAAILVLGFAVARTAFLVSVPITMLESRYLAVFAPLLEVVGVLFVAAAWRGRHRLLRRAAP